MDANQFDALARQLSSRRMVLGGLVAGLLLPLESAFGKGKGKSKGKGKDRRTRKRKDRKRARAGAQADSCWRDGACIPKKGANVSRCDLAGYVPSSTLDCTGCNLSRANLSGALLLGANFTKANLSGACLIHANFAGATFANNTNLANALFCNTTMPDGSVNNSGCGAWTACCSCTPATCQSLGKTCGTWSDGCGGTLQCGSCPNQQICVNGTSCQGCDVCASGCTFSSVQAAIDANNPQLSTIRVCPGTYVESKDSGTAIRIERPLTLIGAGDGDNPATSTILRPAVTNTVVVTTYEADPVRLEGLHITGGVGNNGDGLSLLLSKVTVARCTIAKNHPTNLVGGGMYIGYSDVTLIDTRVTDNTSLVGGGAVVFSSTLQLDAASRIVRNQATGGQSNPPGGIQSDGAGNTITLPSVMNVTGNTPRNCRGGGFTGPGAICTTT